ncbi:unnamed protein product [Paramecium sonneborni]|uniref:Uncharacterized protein n=1 Tax=Paramecium sonneborni TaxID=65129 RepID=A0A8S1PJX4_9CILI|nr:unnamed protein product [Paramecium sonneborni]
MKKHYHQTFLEQIIYLQNSDTQQNMEYKEINMIKINYPYFYQSLNTQQIKSEF